MNESQSRGRNLVVLACRKRMKTKGVEKNPKNCFANVVVVLVEKFL